MRELSDCELIALVAGIPEVKAAALLLEAGGLAALLYFRTDDKPSKRLAAAFELGQRVHAAQKDRLARLSDSAQVAAYFAPKLGGLAHEEMWVVLLDNRNRCVGTVRVATGGATCIAIRPRDILRPVVQSRAVSFLLVHNHPSGDATPSSEDVTLTRMVVGAARTLGAPLLDHVIVAPNGTYTSLLDLGAITPDK